MSDARSRHALIIATSVYEDAGLARLRAPANDAVDMADVLGDPQIGAFTTTVVQDGGEARVRREIDLFLRDRQPGDVVLIYLSCHGLLDERGNLYFAASDTDKSLIDSTAVAAAWLLGRMEKCRPNRQILILDCCFSGAIGRTKSATDVHVASMLEGRGRVVLTASGSTEYSYEGEPLPGADTSRSVFTAALVDGLRTGRADLHRRGVITIDDAYAYAFQEVRRGGTAQTPQINMDQREGGIWLARSRHRDPVTPVTLPPDLEAELQSPDPNVRFAAAIRISQWFQSDDPQQREIARAAIGILSRISVPPPAAVDPAAVDPAAVDREAEPPARTAADVTAAGLAAMDATDAAARLADLTPAEAAEVLARMEPRRTMSRVAAMSPDGAAAVLAAMPVAVAASVLTLYGMSPRRAAMILTEMPSHRVSALLTLLARTSGDRFTEVVTAMPREQAQEALRDVDRELVWRLVPHLVTAPGIAASRIADPEPGHARPGAGAIVMVKIIAALQGAAEDQKRLVRRGVTEVPNRYTVTVSPGDLSRLHQFDPTFANMVRDGLTAFIDGRGWRWPGDLTLEVLADDSYVPGRLDVQAAADAPARAVEPAPEPAWSDAPTPPLGVPLLRPADDDPTPPRGIALPLGPRLRAGDGRTYRIPVGSTVIGRGEQANLRIPDVGIARRHARVDYDRSHLVLTDLGSVNGTFVNGRRVSAVALNPGDRIGLGSTVLTYVVD